MNKDTKTSQNKDKLCYIMLLAAVLWVSVGKAVHSASYNTMTV